VVSPGFDTQATCNGAGKAIETFSAPEFLKARGGLEARRESALSLAPHGGAKPRRSPSGYFDIAGIRATIRSDVDSSSNCNHGRIQAMAL
jgi:hypothetical protein